MSANTIKRKTGATNANSTVATPDRASALRAVFALLKLALHGAELTAGMVAITSDIGCNVSKSHGPEISLTRFMAGGLRLSGLATRGRVLRRRAASGDCRLQTGVA